MIEQIIQQNLKIKGIESRKLRITAFILGKTSMETQLLSQVDKSLKCRGSIFMLLERALKKTPMCFDFSSPECEGEVGTGEITLETTAMETLPI